MRGPRLNAEEIVKFLLANPTVTAKEAGVHFSCHEVTIKAIARKHNIMKGWFQNGDKRQA